jgi:hypothetical protein
MARMPYAAKDRNGVSYPKTTASVLRLIEPYRHCFPLHIRGDSYFASMATVAAVTAWGCHFSGSRKPPALATCRPPSLARSRASSRATITQTRARCPVAHRLPCV